MIYMCIYKYIQDKTPKNIALYKLVLVLVKYGKHYSASLVLKVMVKSSGALKKTESIQHVLGKGIEKG